MIGLENIRTPRQPAATDFALYPTHPSVPPGSFRYMLAIGAALAVVGFAFAYFVNA